MRVMRVMTVGDLFTYYSLRGAGITNSIVPCLRFMPGYGREFDYDQGYRLCALS